MRVIAGIRKGHKLKAPEGMHTRPTTDRVKESVCNLIQLYFPTGTVLDLFGGSGALGIEALSRGAAHAVFVESHPQTCRLLKENLEAVRLADSAEIFRTDALRFLNESAQLFDIIFLDPPYNKNFLEPAADAIVSRGLLSETGIIVAETEAGGELLEHPALALLKRAKYGKTLISIYRYAENSED